MSQAYPIWDALDTSTISAKFFLLSENFVNCSINPDGVLEVTNHSSDSIEIGKVKQKVFSIKKKGLRQIVNLGPNYIKLLSKFLYDDINGIQNMVVLKPGRGMAAIDSQHNVDLGAVIVKPITIQYTRTNGNVETLEVVDAIKHGEIIESYETGVHGTYITNCKMLESKVASNGDTWLFCQVEQSSTAIQLYDVNHEVKQTIPSSRLAANNNYIVCWISSSGFNGWMSLIKGINFNYTKGMQTYMLLDSNDNLYLCGYSTSSTRQNISVYDGYNNLIRQFTTVSNINPKITIVMKYDTSGHAPSIGSNNTWVAYQEVMKDNGDVLFLNMVVDKKDNLVVTTRMNVEASQESFYAYDRDGEIIGGTHISVNSTSPSTVGNGTLVITKYASNGLASNSWKAFITKVGYLTENQNTNSQTYQNLVINSFNEIIISGKYEAEGGIYDKDHNLVGSRFPGPVYATSSYVALLNENGSGGWRRIVKGDSSFAYVANTLIAVDSNDRIIVVGRAYNGYSLVEGVPASAVTIQICGSADDDVGNSYSLTSTHALHVFTWDRQGTTMSYSGRLEGAKLWNENGSPLMANKPYDNYTKLLVDKDNSFLITVPYSNGALTFRDAMGTASGVVSEVGSILDNGEAYNTCIIKFTPTAQIGNFMRIGGESSTGNATPIGVLPISVQFDSRGNIIMTGVYNYPNLCFFKAGNETLPVLKIAGPWSPFIQVPVQGEDNQVILEKQPNRYTFVAKISGDLRNVSVARINIYYNGPSSGNVDVVPVLCKVDKADNIIVVGTAHVTQYSSLGSNLLSFYNFDNYQPVNTNRSWGIDAWNNIFIAKFKSDGDFWASNVTANNWIFSENLLSQEGSLNITNSGDILFTANTSGGARIKNTRGEREGTYQVHKDNGQLNAYLAKYPSNGI